MTDEFSGSSSPSYDPDAVYVDSRDRRGFSTTVRVKVPPGVLDELGTMIASRQLPYRTSQDFFRNAIMHQLHRDAEKANDPRFTELVAEIIAQAGAESDLRTVERRKDLVDTARKLTEAAMCGEQRKEYVVERLTNIYSSLPNGTQKTQIANMLEHMN